MIDVDNGSKKNTYKVVVNITITSKINMNDGIKEL